MYNNKIKNNLKLVLTVALISHLGIGCKKESVEPTSSNTTTTSLSGLTGSKVVAREVTKIVVKQVVKNEISKKIEELKSQGGQGNQNNNSSSVFNGGSITSETISQMAKWNNEEHTGNNKSHD